jgi:hypothetical protein
MQRFKSPEQAQDFLSAHSFIYGHFRPRRHRLTATTYRLIRTQASMSGTRQRASKMPRDVHRRSAPTSGCPTKVNVAMPSDGLPDVQAIPLDAVARRRDIHIDFVAGSRFNCPSAVLPIARPATLNRWRGGVSTSSSVKPISACPDWY